MDHSLARTVSSQLTTRLRDRILSGAYAPGSQLLQDSIAAEYGVSKIPVREALVYLQGEGLVDIFSHRGFQVRPLSIAELEEVFRLRLQLEPVAVAAGARKASAEDRQAAKAALADLNAALAAGQLADSGALNRAFHLALVVPRLQPLTGDILSRLHTLAQRYVRIHLSPRGRSKRATKEHTALFKAWQVKESREAGRLIRLHIEETREELTEYLQGGASGAGGESAPR